MLGEPRQESGGSGIRIHSLRFDPLHVTPVDLRLGGGVHFGGCQAALRP
jgi:hypothetical protein